MLNALFLMLATLGISGQSILKKSYNLKTGNKGSFVFASLSVFFAALFFLAISRFDLHFRWEILPYAFGFALAYGTAVVMILLAIKLGSLSLTLLVYSYSLIIPTFYGLFFLGEEVGLLFYVGLALLFISLFLMNAKHTGARITLPWIVAVFLAFLGNGLCSTVQMVQQKTFNGQYKSEMMIIALFTVFLVMLTLSLVFQKKEIAPAIRNGGPIAAACGVTNGLCNLLVMLLAVRMNASLMFPVISAGGILLTVLVSLLLYKEKLSRGQYLALILGTASVVLMNVS